MGKRTPHRGEEAGVRDGSAAAAHAVDVAAKLEVLVRKLSALRDRMSKLEEGLDDIDWKLRELLAELSGMRSFPVSPSRGNDRSAHRKILHREAEKGVSDARVERFLDHAELRIEGGPGIRLPDHLANLMEVLLEDRGGQGILVDWKSIHDISAALAKRSDDVPKQGAVRTRIYRLRKRLGEAGENPFLVQVLRRGGARFALRRRLANETEARDRSE